MGDLTNVSRIVPGIVHGLTHVKNITVGNYHSIALKEDGSLWAWGYNNNGQLGEGAVTIRQYPVQIQFISEISAIGSHGIDHSVALQSDGVLLAWGNNNHGQLGIGTNVSSLIPATINLVSHNADLKGLILSNGSLSPDFSSSTTDYSATVGNSVASITVSPNFYDSFSTVFVNETQISSGSPSGAIALNEGSNIISIVVTAQDTTTTKTYTITVNRNSLVDTLENLTLSTGTLSPEFSAGTVSYTVNVANADTLFIVTPTVASTTALVSVNGVSVTSGAASSAISLNVGDNTITVLVTAEDSTTKTYTIVVHRPSNNANLISLTSPSGSLSPEFSTGVLQYKLTVGNEVTSLTFTPAVDSITSVTINGLTVPSGTASTAIPLNIGHNTILIAVTSEDTLNVKTYTITVARLLSDSLIDIDLSGKIKIDDIVKIMSDMTLQQDFNIDDIFYMLNRIKPYSDFNSY